MNGNPHDNSIDNISIGTDSDNMMDMPSEVRLRKAKHPGARLKKITDDQLPAVQWLRSIGMSMPDIGLMFGVRKSTVHNILTRRCLRAS